MSFLKKLFGGERAGKNGPKNKTIREVEEAQAQAGDGSTLPSLELPPFVLGDYESLRGFEQHFANLFEPRLYCDPHDSYICTIAEIAEMVIQASDAGEAPRTITDRLLEALRSAGIETYISQNNPSQYYLGAYLDIAWDMHQKRESLRPFVKANPELLHKLSDLAGQIERKAVPPAKWIEAARMVAAKAPDDTWLACLAAITETEALGSSGESGVNREQYLRTLIYIGSFLPPASVGPILAQYALKKCYITQPGIGIKSEKLGNACVWAIANMPDGAGVPYLARILARTKYPKIRKKINLQLNEAAQKVGISRADLDEATVPTHGLDQHGKRVIAFQNGSATLITEGGNARIEWANAAGKTVKAPTAAIKEEKELLKEVKADLKELQADLSIQPQRLQKLYLQDRRWTVEDWRERYLEQPLMRGFTRRLIWIVEREGADPVAAIPDEAGQHLLDIVGDPVSLTGASIRLWHPMDSSVNEIEAWRDRFEELQITQPFAQIWREVYALTDAERQTETYSNRWAAHILKQQQAMTLARINGWTVTARMWVDAPNDAPWHLHLPEHGLVAQYWVEGAGGDDPEVTDSCAYSFVNTDRVTFFRAQEGANDSAHGPSIGDPLPLADISPVIFSEVMRSCDLFTAVASIAADPAWLDRGQDAAHPNQWGHHAQEYWHRTNTADLVESGKRRRKMLERIIPRLAIADQLTLTDKMLEVKGSLHTYQIHLGSGACARSNRHICIVPKNTKGADKVWLPFEGDRTLSIIISKAVLLAADSKITDPVILAQL